jgi:hypothetical protein
MHLDDIIGQKITVALINSSKSHYTVTVRGVEAGGIWAEGKELDALIGHRPNRLKRPDSRKPPTRPVFFIPYAQIGFAVYDSIDLSG